MLGAILEGWRTVCAVERNPYCQAILLARQADCVLEPFPIWEDIRDFDGTDWRGKIDIITSGFPCQPFSHAGKRKGSADERNGWPDTRRVLCEVQPEYALLENVPGLLTSGYFGTVLGDLAESGFDARWKVISAAELGAPHKRDRLWILAYPNECRRSSEYGKQQTSWASEFNTSRKRELANTKSKRWQWDWLTWPRREGFENGSWWKIEPGMGRMVDGLDYRMDRLKTIGNGQVPAVAATAWRILSKGLI